MPARILVVDDEPHILLALDAKLRSAGYEVVTARDGRAAMVIAREQRLDLVITDFKMPHLSGIELCRMLGAEESTASVPVIMLTARGHALDAAEAEAAGLRGVIAKPFSARGLIETIERLLHPPRAA